jgi:hypothetical protein
MSGEVGPLQQVNAQQINPNQIPQVNGQQIDINQIISLLGGGPNRSAVRDVSAQAVGNQATQSVDQLGGQNSAFFRNMQAQLQPSFDQQRALALAQAKESAGNLTGSGLGNYLGSAVNRSLGDQQALLANYASQGLNTEVGRQLQQAGLNQQVGLANAGNQLAAGQSNQGADLGVLQALMQHSGLAAQLGLQGAQSNQQAGLVGQQANQGAAMQALLANQGTNLAGQQTNQASDLQRQLQNRQVTQGVYGQQADLNQQRNLAQYGTQSELANQNAQRFLQLLLGMNTTGVQGNTVTQSGGIGSVLGPIANLAGTIYGANKIAGSR